MHEQNGTLREPRERALLGDLDVPLLLAGSSVVALPDDPVTAAGLAGVMRWSARLAWRATAAEAAALLVYRATWDDFRVVAVEAEDAELRRALTAVNDPARQWQSADARGFTRRSVYLLGEDALARLELGRAVRLLRPFAKVAVVPIRDDAETLGLLVLVLGADARLGTAGSDVLADVAQWMVALVAVARTGAAAQHQAALLEDLLAAVNRISPKLPPPLMLKLWCDTVRRVAGFQNVFAGIYGSTRARKPFRHREAVGWREADDPGYSGLALPNILPLLGKRFASEGCALVPIEAAAAAIPDVGSRSLIGATGPDAWSEHWLLVPLFGRAAELIGVARLDEPADMLLPRPSTLRAIRLFGNHLAQAIELRAAQQPP